jgi:hypothetical protein
MSRKELLSRAVVADGLNLQVKIQIELKRLLSVRSVREVS